MSSAKDQQGWADWPQPAQASIPSGALKFADGRILCVTEPFRMGRFAVTFDEFDRYCLATGRALKPDEGWGRGDLPVIHVSFDEAEEYAGWLTMMTGRQVRLPTGDEWEYAARAGALTCYCWGDRIEPGDANYLETPGFGPFPVASLRPNAWGLYNMLGNVAEWVLDAREGIDAPAKPGWHLRAARGGHWASPGRELDLAVVQLVPRGEGSDRTGLRLVFET